MQDLDLFVVYRRLLLIFGTTYSLVKAASLIARVVRFARGRDTKTVLLRHYLYAHLAEMRPARFLPDMLQIATLVVIPAGVLYLHRF